MLAIYGLDDQRRLLEQLGSKLNEDRRNALAFLVSARGPLPADLVLKIEATLTWPGKDFDYIARKMNERGIVTGIGRGAWTATKVKRKLAEAQAEETEAA